MEQTKLDKPIGTKETKKQLEPKICTIIEIKIEPQKSGDKLLGDIVVVTCKHPDREEFLEIKKTKFEKDKVLKVSGLWYNEDDDGAIPKNSALAAFMNHYSAKTLRELTGKPIQTTYDENNFLVIKSY